MRNSYHFLLLASAMFLSGISNSYAIAMKSTKITLGQLGKTGDIKVKELEVILGKKDQTNEMKRPLFPNHLPRLKKGQLMIKYQQSDAMRPIIQ